MNIAPDEQAERSVNDARWHGLLCTVDDDDLREYIASNRTLFEPLMDADPGAIEAARAKEERRRAVAYCHEKYPTNLVLPKAEQDFIEGRLSEHELADAIYKLALELYPAHGTA